MTNTFLEELDIGTNRNWIMERVGIEERHTVLPLDYIKVTRNVDPRAALEASLYGNARTGAEAARMALKRASLQASDIGLVISGACVTERFARRSRSHCRNSASRCRASISTRPARHLVCR